MHIWQSSATTHSFEVPLHQAGSGWNHLSPPPEPCCRVVCIFVEDTDPPNHFIDQRHPSQYKAGGTLLPILFCLRCPIHRPGRLHKQEGSYMSTHHTARRPHQGFFAVLQTRGCDMTPNEAYQKTKIKQQNGQLTVIDEPRHHLVGTFSCTAAQEGTTDNISSREGRTRGLMRGQPTADSCRV